MEPQADTVAQATWVRVPIESALAHYQRAHLRMRLETPGHGLEWHLHPADGPDADWGRLWICEVDADGVRPVRSVSFVERGGVLVLDEVAFDTRLAEQWDAWLLFTWLVGPRIANDDTDDFA